MAKTDQDREDFEAAARADGLAPETWDDEEKMYDDSDTQWMWQGWQAALAHERSRAQGEPVAWVNESYRDSILEHSGKAYWHGPMMCGKEFKGSFPVYLAAPARPVAVPVDILQRDAARWRSLARNTGGEEDLTRDPNGPHTLHIKIDVSGCEVWINDKIDFVGTLEKAIDAEIAEFGLEAAAPAAPPAESGEVEPSPEECPTCGAVDPEKHCRMDWADMGCDHPRRLREVEEDMAALFGTAPPPEPAKDEVGVEPVAWRVRVASPDPEEWSLLPAGGGADYAMRTGYEVQPLYATPPTAPAAASYHVPEPKGGWRKDFSPDEKAKLRPVAETLALLDGNAFFGADTRIEWFEAYLPEAHALYEANGGDAGWAGRASFAAPAAARSAAEAKMHAVNLEQCSIFVDSNPIKRAMTDAAAFIRASIPGEEA